MNLLLQQFDMTCDVNNFTVKLSETSKRLDASYHVAIAKTIIEHLQIYALEVLTISDSRISKEIILPGRFKRYMLKKGKVVCFSRAKVLWNLILLIKSICLFCSTKILFVNN